MRLLRLAAALAAVALLASGCGQTGREREDRLAHSEQAIALALDTDVAGLPGIGVETDDGSEIACVDSCPTAWVTLPVGNAEHPGWEPRPVVQRLLAHGYTLRDEREAPAPPTATPSDAAARACLHTRNGQTAWSCDLVGTLARISINMGYGEQTFEITATGEP